MADADLPDGLRCDGLATPCVFEGPIDGASFRAYVEQVLVPTLRPGDIVILDHLGGHKSQTSRAGIRQVFAKHKTLLRQAAERTVDETWKRIGALLPNVTARECANSFKNAGYASP